MAALIGCLPLWASGVELDEQAQQWLEQHRSWHVGVAVQAPYARLRPGSGQLEGLSVEFTEAMARQLGVSLTWQAYRSEADLEQALAAGEVDLVAGVQQTPEALRRWRFSDPYWRVPHLLIGDRREAPGVELKALNRAQPLAVREGDPLNAYLLSNYVNLSVQRHPSARQALRAVLAQRAGYAAIDQARFSALSQESEFAGLAALADVGVPQLLRFATARNEAELAEVLNYGLRLVPRRELETLQRRWLASQAPHWSDSVVAWRAVALVLGVMLVVALVLLVELRRQRGRLEKRLIDTRATLTQREVGEQALRLAQFSLDHSTVGILWVGWDSRVRYANRAAADMLGYHDQALNDVALQQLEPALGMDRWIALWKRVRAAEEGALRFETLCRRADGSELPADVTLDFLSFRDAEYLVVYLSDVTEQRRARAALQESEERLNGIAGNVPGLLFRLERPTPSAPPEFAFVSQGSEQLVGYAAAQVMDRQFGIRSLVHPNDRASYHRSQDEALQQARDWHWQGRILTRDGQERWADIKASVRHLDEGHVVWDGVVWDVTDNKLTELELATSRAQLRQLSAHLESVREEEKARIAREVHDELGQVLTVLKMETSMCALAFAELDPALNQRLESMHTLIAQLFQLVRDVATALRPPILDAGIASAIEWQVRRFEARTGIAALVQVPEQSLALSSAKAVGLFRVLQEALTNVMRHAQASMVDVELSQSGDQLLLRISDDGKGFAPEAPRERSFGLVGMRERVLMLGGTLTLDSQPGEGTTLLVTIGLDGEGIA